MYYVRILKFINFSILSVERVVRVLQLFVQSESVRQPRNVGTLCVKVLTQELAASYVEDSQRGEKWSM